MVITPPPPMTEDEFEDWALTNDVRAEYVDGAVEIMSPENRNTDKLGHFLRTVLDFCVQHDHLGEVHGPNYMVRLRVGLRRVPDILFVGVEHLDRLGEKRLDGPPDLAIEVVSRDSKIRDRKVKLQEYEASGVREYWIVDPLIRQVQVNCLGDDGRYVLIPRQDGWYVSRLVPRFRVRPEDLWRYPPPALVPFLRELGVL